MQRNKFLPFWDPVWLNSLVPLHFKSTTGQSLQKPGAAGASLPPTLRQKQKEREQAGIAPLRETL